MKISFESFLAATLIIFGVVLSFSDNNEPKEKAQCTNVVVEPIVEKVTYSYKDTISKFILHHEGELSNHPADPGGLTNKGVTWSSFKLFSKKCEYTASSNLFFAMPDSVWNEIFILHWNVFEGLESPLVRSFCTDYIWGSGTKGKKEIQKVVKMFVPSQPITGYIGPETVSNMNSIPETQLYNELYKNRVSFLNGIDYSKYFIKGWMKRVKHLDHVLKNSKQPRYASL